MISVNHALIIHFTISDFAPPLLRVKREGGMMPHGIGAHGAWPWGWRLGDVLCVACESAAALL